MVNLTKHSQVTPEDFQTDNGGFLFANKRNYQVNGDVLALKITI